MTSSAPNDRGSDAYLDDVEEILAAGIEEFAGDWTRTEAELTRRHPQHAASIRRRVAALQGEGWLLRPPGPNEGFPDHLGDFRLVRRLGAGGMGVVFLAEQETLGRQVALKILPRQSTLDPRFLERFHREAHAAARLQHPNIVPVYGVGMSDGVHWYAMQYVDGIALDDLLVQARLWWSQADESSPSPAPTTAAQAMAALLAAAESGGSSSGGSVAWQRPKDLELRSGVEPDPALLGKYHRSAARMALQVNDALAFAHGQGVLHRDIKPSNLLLDERGRVWVADFGLCKTEESGGLTLTGDMVGTLRYMAPEQLSGQGDVRSEIYSLGATLYELLTLQPAFEHSSRHELMRQIAEDEPVAPTRVDPRIPRDLEAIVLKAMRKDPGERYATADAMARDLAAYLDGRPIAARSPSALYYLRLAVRRNRTLTATIAGALVAVLALTLVYIGHLESARQTAENAREDARWRAYLASVGAAESAIQLGDVVVARQRLGDAPAEYRGWEWQHYQSRLDQSVAAFPVPISACVACSMDGSSLFVGSDDAAIRQLDERSGEVIRKLTGHRGFLHDLDVSRDGRLLASAGSVDQTAGIWDLENGTARWLRHPHEVQAVAFHPDGALLATGCDDAVVRLWATDSAAETGRLEGHRSGVHAVAFDREGLRLATGSVDGTARIWDLASGKCLHVLPHGGVVKAVAFAPEGRALLTAGESGIARIWEVGSGKEILPLRGHRAGIPAAAWSPSGALIATASGDGTVRIWDAATGTEQTVLSGHGDWALDVAFSPDGSRLASVGRDGTVRQWDATSLPPVTTLQAHLSQTEALAVSPDGMVIATGGRSGVVRLWDTRTGLDRGAFLSHPSGVNALVFAPTGGRLAVGGEDTGEVKIWDAATLRHERTLQANLDSILGIAFCRDGHLLAAGAGGATRFDLETGQPIQTIAPAKGYFHSIALHPRLEVAAVGSSVGEILFWDLASGTTESRPGHDGRVGKIAFHPDGSLLSIAADGTLRLWDAVNRQLLDTVPAHSAPAFALGVHPDGSRLATGSTRGELKIWSYPELREVAVLRDTRRWIQKLAFDPRGHQLLMAGLAQVTIWDNRPPALHTAARRAAMDARTTARPMVEDLFRRFGTPDEVEAAVNQMNLEPTIAEQALALARSRAATPNELFRRAWDAAVRGDAGPPGPGWPYNMARTLMQHDPSDPRHQALLGIASYRVGRLAAAHTALLQAQRMYQQDGVAEPWPSVLARIMVMARAGNVQAARGALDSVVERQSELDAEARALLSEALSTVSDAEGHDGGHRQRR